MPWGPHLLAIPGFNDQRMMLVVNESKCLDTPILEFSIICEHLPFLLGYKLILRLLLVHRNLAIWR